MNDGFDEIKFKYSSDASFDDLVKALNLSGKGYVAIVNQEDRLVGIFTDADLRKAVINNKRSLDDVINRKPKVLKQNTSRRMIVNYLKKIRRRHVPLIRDDGTYAGVFSLDDLDFNIKPNAVVIMAGGLGTRMQELTKEIPKPMLKVGDKPVLERIIEHFSDNGFTKFILCVNYKKEVIKEYFQDGYEFGVNIKYVEENKRLGTAGALSLVECNGSSPLIVVNGDVLTNVNYSRLLEWHMKSGADATMCLREYTHKVPFGVVDFDINFDITNFLEKPIQRSFVNAGIYVLNPSVINKVPKDMFYDMPSLFEDLKGSEFKLKAYVMNDYWIDIGMKETYSQANYDFEESIS